MKKISAILLVLGIASPAFPQAVPGVSADEAWGQVLQFVSRRVPPAQRPAKRTAEQIERERMLAAAEARRGAIAARDFHTTYPAHRNVPRARKLEVLLSLQGVTDADAAFESSAHAKATAYRKDSANSTADRFEVGLSSDLVRARAKLRKAPGGGYARELEGIASKLRQEMGDLPQLFEFYASIARLGDMATSRRVAENLSLWPAPAAVKAEAKSILDRHNLLHRPLDVAVPSFDGTQRRIQSAPGRKTVLFVWKPSPGINHLASLKHRRSLLAGADVAYVAVGATPQAVSADTATLPLPGRVYYDRQGTSIVAAGLNVRALPYVFVVNSAGAISGFGPAVELPALLAAAN